MNAMNEKSLILDLKAEECGAVLMVPPIEEETPFSPEELKMEFGSHVQEGGVDYSSAIANYLSAVHGQKKEAEPLPTIAELFNEETKAGMQLNLALVLARDTKEYRNHGFRSLEDWVNSNVGVPMNHSTIHRRIVHGRCAMLFAAKGMIDKLPSQAQCTIISRLPRAHWLDAWKAIQTGSKFGKDALINAVANYARQHRLPSRGKPIDSVLEDAPVMTPLKLNPVPINTTGTTANSTPTLQPAKAPETPPLLNVIAEMLPRYLPAYRHKYLAKRYSNPARRFVSALKAQIRKCPEPERMDLREELFTSIQQSDPELAEQINRTARAIFFKAATKKIR